MELYYNQHLRVTLYCSIDQWGGIESSFPQTTSTFHIDSPKTVSLIPYEKREVCVRWTSQPFFIFTETGFMFAKKWNNSWQWQYFKQAAAKHLKKKKNSKQSLTHELFPSVTEVFGTWSPTLSREGIWIDVTNVKQGQLSDVSQSLLVHFCTLYFLGIMMHSHHT